MIDLYSCNVRLAGNLLHEVPRSQVTANEIFLLKHIHGSDGVVGLKKTGNVNMDRDEDLRRLARVYGRQRVETAFNTILDNFDEWLAGQLEAEESINEEKKNEREAEAKRLEEEEQARARARIIQQAKDDMRREDAERIAIAANATVAGLTKKSSTQPPQEAA